MIARQQRHDELVSALDALEWMRAAKLQEIVGRHLYNFIPSPELVPKP